ncbi:ankyrin repeat domain-containing protein [Akkermansia sp. N21116]|uniref:ankyrin repeat domain-containing protein n=1 Tax=Akkermansia sp. N21116 TaxID=3040764 RepID=UPI002AC909E8|nr:ankyrin repeat domain-containing protein [Akkermansia sp. N21116]WPX40435.1 ankyrin repeat domain-containing protein [Akkermansia sp. N21116]
MSTTMQQFYVILRDQEYGPFSYAHIQLLVKEGKIGDTTPCRSEHMTGYLPYKLLRQAECFTVSGKPKKKKSLKLLAIPLLCLCIGAGVWYYTQDRTLDNYTALFQKKANEAQEASDKEFWISMAKATQKADTIDNIDFLLVGSKYDIPLLCAAADKGASKLIRYLVNHGASVDIRDQSQKTPLRIAARKGSLAAVTELVNAKADLNATDKQGRTPLMGAAWMGHKNIVDLLLKQGAKIDDKDKIGQTALAWAAEGGKLDIVVQLIQAGAQVDNTWGRRSPITLAYGNKHMVIVAKLLKANPNVESSTNILQIAINETDLPLARLAIEHGATVNDKLWSLALNNGHPELVELMMQHGANPVREVQSFYGTPPPIDIVIKSGNLDTVKMLLRKGAVFTADSLSAAISSDSKDIAQIIIDKGISPTSIKQDKLLKMTIRHATAGLAELLIKNGLELDTRNHSQETPLMLAIYEGRTSLVKLFLEQGAKADDVDNNGLTPLMIAAYKGNKDIYDLVRKASKNLSAKDQKGRSVLRWAAKGRNIDIVRDAIIIPRVSVNEKDTVDGETPLMSAANNGNADIVKLLLDNGANVNIKGNNGETALLWAAQTWSNTHYSHKNYRSVIEQLISKGADTKAENKNGETALTLIMKKDKTYEKSAIEAVCELLQK